MLSEEQIKKYQEVHKQVFGTDISRDEALGKGMRLLNLMRTLYRPIPQQELKKAEARIKDFQPIKNI